MLKNVPTGQTTPSQNATKSKRNRIGQNVPNANKVGQNVPNLLL